MKKLSKLIVILFLLLGCLMQALNTGELIVQVLIAMATELVTRVTDTLCSCIDDNTFPMYLFIHS